jgi:excisionase family DNA binding protein
MLPRCGQGHFRSGLPADGSGVWDVSRQLVWRRALTTGRALSLRARRSYFGPSTRPDEHPTHRPVCPASSPICGTIESWPTERARGRARRTECLRGCRPAWRLAGWQCWRHSSMASASCSPAGSGRSPLLSFLHGVSLGRQVIRTRSRGITTRCHATGPPDRDEETQNAVGSPRMGEHAAIPAARDSDPSSPPGPARRTTVSEAAGQTRQPATTAIATTLGLRVLTATEAASVLRVDTNVIVKAITNGELPGNRIGNQWRVDQGALTRWLQGKYETTAEPSGYPPSTELRTDPG